MNEQLVVKNFGPIEDATVDFKRVTVFIGPTGGGKSTLAKLAAIFNEGSTLKENADFAQLLTNYGISGYRREGYGIDLLNASGRKISVSEDSIKYDDNTISTLEEGWNNYLKDLERPLLPPSYTSFVKNFPEEDTDEAIAALSKAWEALLKQQYFKGLMLLKFRVHYIPAERLLVSTLNASWPALISAKVDFPKTLLDFAAAYLKAGSEIKEMDVHFLSTSYTHENERGFITSGSIDKIAITEAASGIQSVVPMLLILERFSQDIENPQSFIIEEPELNLYPTAQRDLVYTMLEKCTQGKNDLTITTHSPYVLSALNLALYANKVATSFPHQRKKVAKLLPEKYWLKADEFSAYFVAKGGAKTIFDTKTGLLSESQLDEVSGEFADVFDQLTDLRVPEKKAPAKVKSVKK